MIPGGGKGKKVEMKERRRERREINAVSPPVNCLLVYAEGSRGGISNEAQVGISLLLPLIGGRSHSSLLLPPLSPCVLPFAKSRLPRRNEILKKWPRARVVNQLDPDWTRRRAGRDLKIRQTKSPPASREGARQEVSEGNSLINQLPPLG